MTKKDFKLKCSFHHYGKGKNKRNAIYYDWQNYGFSFMVKAPVSLIKLNDLFNVLYNYINKNEAMPYYVQYKSAVTDNERFKVSLMG